MSLGGDDEVLRCSRGLVCVVVLAVIVAVIGPVFLPAGMVDASPPTVVLRRESASVTHAGSHTLLRSIHATHRLPSVPIFCLGASPGSPSDINLVLALGSRRIPIRATQSSTEEFSGEGRTLDILASSDLDASLAGLDATTEETCPATVGPTVSGGSSPSMRTAVGLEVTTYQWNGVPSPDSD
jgi:hypothetical protein